MSASTRRRLTGPARARDSSTLLAHGCSSRTACTEIALLRTDALQPRAPVGTSNSATTRSAISSRMSSLSRTWL